MADVGIEWILLIAWLISHGIYRGGVGTWCAIKGTEPPWVKARQEKLTNQEIRRSRRREATSSKRTARGFIARLWGDLWEDAHKAVDQLRSRDEDTEIPAGVKPLVPADAGESWVRDLGAKATAAAGRVRDLWNRWWLPSRRQCPWTYPVLPDGVQCGRRVPKGCDYCAEHQVEAAVGHCLFGYGNPTMDDCERPREEHFPWCTHHLDEWERHGGQQPATAEPAAAATPEAPQVGMLDTPDAPTLEGVVPTSPAAAADDPSTGEKPLCQWGRGATSESPDHGQAPCTERAGAGGIHCSPHQIEYGRWEARNTPPPPTPGPEPATVDAVIPAADSAVTCRQTVDTSAGAGFFGPCGRPVPSGATTPDCGQHDPAPQIEVPSQRPQLRIVPNTNTQGDTNAMTAPTQPMVAEAATTQTADAFADSVISSGNVDWPNSVEEARKSMATFGLTNDEAIVTALESIKEAAKSLAAAGEELKAAVAAHDGATEQVSGLGDKAASDTRAYQRN